jgi:TatD DNase family protein
MIERATQNGVSRMICVGVTQPDSAHAAQFVQNRANCWASIGIHPHEANSGQQALDALAPLATKPKVVAVGEIGLDYFYSHSTKEEQIKALRFQIELALEHNLPIIFHVREAFDDFWPIFDSYNGIRGVLHSFTDNHTNFQKAMERQLYIGINGITTFTKVEEQLQIAKEVPLQKLLLETDAPFLTPTPLRGTVNEPAHVRLVAEFLADLRSQTIEDLAANTTQNAQTLFALS